MRPRLPREVIPMNNDLQKASLLKRFSAYLVDLMALLCVVTLVALCLSAALGYNDYSERMDAIYEKYGMKDFTDGEMTEEQTARFNEAVKAFNEDEEALAVYSKVIDLSLIIATMSTLVAFLLLELIVPLCLKNGQTFGKKIFGLGLMRTDGVKVTPFMMFVRAMLGKYVVETMIPLLLIIMMMLGASIGLMGLLVIALVWLLEIVLLFATRNHTTLHDLLACTIEVDLGSQRIFDSAHDRVEYMKRVSAEAAAKAKYF